MSDSGPRKSRYDAIVIGSGPNGLAAAVTLAENRLSTLLVEAKDKVGGGLRTKELTLPGFKHDVCAAIHPLALASPFFKKAALESWGLEWVHPPIPLAHPLDDQEAVLLHRSLQETAAGLGEDRDSYTRLLSGPTHEYEKLVDDLLRPLGPPRHPLALLRFAPHAMRSATGFARSRFKGVRARALIAGNAAHGIFPLEAPSSAAFGIMLPMLGHAVGWPIAKGGSEAVANAFMRRLESSGVETVVNFEVRSLDDLPPARLYMCDVAPRRLAQIAGSRFPKSYHARLEAHSHGAGVFKLDWALNGPIPWRDPKCADAGTLHLGGTLEEIAASERAPYEQTPAERPFTLLSQPSLFDMSRAPAGMHTAWAYCHVPNGCDADMTTRIENQVERFAPGFHDRIIGRSAMSPSDMEAYNPNYIGGDIVGGMQTFQDLFVLPMGRVEAYSTPDPEVYLCSSSMPPGGGVHGMCGYLAAEKALRRLK